MPKQEDSHLEEGNLVSLKSETTENVHKGFSSNILSSLEYEDTNKSSSQHQLTLKSGSMSKNLTSMTTSDEPDTSSTDTNQLIK